jgi:UDPglucose 6-dehydrogenase
VLFPDLGVGPARRPIELQYDDPVVAAELIHAVLVTVERKQPAMPKTDVMRQAPAVPIINSLLEKGAKVQAYDPEAMKVAKGIFGSKVTFTTKNYDALKNADALAVITEWQEFREPDFARIKKMMRTPVIFDGRNIYQPDQMKALGFTYVSMGR